METIAVTMIALEASLGSTPKLTPIAARMKENSPICASATATERAMRKGLAEELDHNEGGQGFADEDDSERGEDEGPVADERGGVEQHPHGNEEEDGEGRRAWQASAAACELNSDCRRPCR